MSNPNVDRAAEECAKRAQNLPESVQFAIINVLPNIPNGAFWGFTDTNECMKFAESLKGDQNIILRKLKGGKSALVEVNPDYLIKATRMVSASLISDNDIALMRDGIAKGAAAFEKFLMSKGDRGFKATVGIYCINDSSSITYKKVAYPAFRVDVRTALNLMQKWGYYISVDGKMVQPSQAMSMQSKLFASMTLSPTTTGVFVDIACSYTAEQIKQLKVQYGITKGKATK